MINWDAHVCLPQHPHADFTPVRKLHAAGVNYVSLNAVSYTHLTLPTILLV